MDAEAWKILIGAVAVVASGLGGQWLAGRNNRINAETTHERELNKWATDLKYETYLNLIQQFESIFRLLTRASRGEEKDLPRALAIMNNLKATSLRIVGSKEVRDMANDLDMIVRQWYDDIRLNKLEGEEVEAARSKNLAKFQSLVDRVRVELGTHAL
ncbi:UNVERIFIED_ORG: hypothetical protein ABID57_003084 [Arthrobacter sp. UYEF1]